MTVLSESHQGKEQVEGRGEGDKGKRGKESSKVIPGLYLEDILN